MLQGVGGGGGIGGLGAFLGEVLAVAGAVDVDSAGVHGEAVEDGGGDGGIAKVLAPGAQLDIGGNGGGGLEVTAVQEIEEHVSGGGLVAGAFDLAEADVVNDEELSTRPAAEAVRVAAVGETCVEVIEQVDAAGVADNDLALTGAKRDGLEQMAFAGAALTSKENILVLVEEAQAGDGFDGGAIELGLKCPIEGFQGFSHVPSLTPHPFSDEPRNPSPAGAHH